MNFSKVNNKDNINGDIVKLTITKILTTLIATITSMLLARYRSLTEYGTYSQMLIVINLFTSIFLLGLPNSLNYFLSRAESESEKQEFINVYYTLSTILSFILGLSLLLSSNIIVQYFNNDFIISFTYFLALYPWTKIISNSIENLFVVYRKTKLLLIIKLVHNLILLGLVFFFQIAKLPFETYMVFFTIIEVAITFFDYFAIRNVTGSLRPLLIWKMIKKIFSFSIPIGLASIVGIVNIELDKIVIDRFFSTEALGVYSACSTELPLTIVATSITAVALPQMVTYVKHGEILNAVEKWKKTIIVSLSIIAFFSIGLAFFSEDAVLLLYGDKYLSGVNVFRIYSLVLLFKCTYWGMLLNSMGKTKFILASSILVLILNFFLNYICCFAFGFIGPAIATLFSTTFMNLNQLIATSLLSKIKFSNLMPWKNIIEILVINITLGFFFAALKVFIPFDLYFSGIGETLILAIAWGLVYIVVYGRTIKNVWITI